MCGAVDSLGITHFGRILHNLTPISVMKSIYMSPMSNNVSGNRSFYGSSLEYLLSPEQVVLYLWQFFSHITFLAGCIPYCRYFMDSLK